MFRRALATDEAVGVRSPEALGCASIRGCGKENELQRRQALVDLAEGDLDAPEAPVDSVEACLHPVHAAVHVFDAGAISAAERAAIPAVGCPAGCQGAGGRLRQAAEHGEHVTPETLRAEVATLHGAIRSRRANTARGARSPAPRTSAPHRPQLAADVVAPAPPPPPVVASEAPPEAATAQPAAVQSATSPAAADRLGNRIAELAARIQAATYELLVLIREFDASGGWSGFASCAVWLSWRTGLAPGAAREHVRVVQALEYLPELSDAMRRGRVSYSKVRAVTLRGGSRGNAGAGAPGGGRMSGTARRAAAGGAGRGRRHPRRAGDGAPHRLRRRHRHDAARRGRRRAGRRPPDADGSPALRRALAARDGQCRFPGCAARRARGPARTRHRAPVARLTLRSRRANTARGAAFTGAANERTAQAWLAAADVGRRTRTVSPRAAAGPRGARRAVPAPPSTSSTTSGRSCTPSASPPAGMRARLGFVAAGRDRGLGLDCGGGCTDTRSMSCIFRRGQPFGVLLLTVVGLGAAVEPRAQEGDRSALVAFYDATGGAHWSTATRWNSRAPIGEWHGVTSDGAGRVTRLVLPANNLTGRIPPELGALASLEFLFLPENDLTGRIPPELGALANLRTRRPGGADPAGAGRPGQSRHSPATRWRGGSRRSWAP